MPLCTLRLQHIKGLGNTSLASAAYRKLHDDNRKAQAQQAGQIDQHEGRASVSTDDIRETPHVSQSDGADCRNQDKAETG